MNKDNNKITYKLFYITSLIVGFLLMENLCYAQQLNKQMRIDSLNESIKINPEADKAYLHVRSQISNLRFESNRRVDKVNQLSSGDWEVWLPAGTHILKIDAEGFQRLELQPFNFAKKRSYELIISAIGFAPTERADENLTELRFKLNEDSVYSSYADFTPILSIEKTITYKLPKGEYTFRFWKTGFRELTQTINALTSEEISIQLIPSIATRETKQIALPGFVRLTTEPSGAEIMLNGQKVGVSPFQSELTAGSHQIELHKPLYHTDISSFTVEEGKTVSLSRSLKPRFGYLTINGLPSESVLYLDGKEFGQPPISRKEVESSHHILRIEKRLYHTYTQEFDIQDGEDKTITVEMNPAFGSLAVTSMPEDSADVFLDGKKVGITPYTNNQLPSGKYVLKVSKSFYRDAEEEVVIIDRGETKKAIEMRQNFGTLSLSAPKSQIYIDGSFVGRDSYSGRLQPGTHKVRVEREGPYQPIEKDIFISIGENRQEQLEPEGRIGTLSITVEPFEAGDAEIYLNKEIKGTAPLALKILKGEYEITAKKTGYLDLNQTVNILENETARLNLIMVTYQGSRQAVTDRWGTIKWWSGAGSLLAGGAAVYFNMKSNDYYQKYQTASTSEQAIAYREKTQNNDLYYKISIGATGTLLLTTIVSSLIQVIY